MAVIAPPESALPKSATMVINWLVEYTIDHSENASEDSLMHAALNDVLKRLSPQERLEVESDVHDLTDACRKRRKNELNHCMLNYLNTMEGHDNIRESKDLKDEEDIELPKEDMEKLIMYFKGNREKAVKFLAKIRGITDYEKAALVNSLVRSGDLIKEYKHRKLWSLLHRNGLYSKSESNWNKIIE